VQAVTDFTITGRLARFGRGGMMEDISNRLMRDFSACLQSRIGAEPATGGAATEEVAAADPPPTAAGAQAPDPPAPAAPPIPAPATPPQAAAAKPISGFSLILGALLDRIKRLFGRGRR